MPNEELPKLALDCITLKYGYTPVKAVAEMLNCTEEEVLDRFKDQVFTLEEDNVTTIVPNTEGPIIGTTDENRT